MKRVASCLFLMMACASGAWAATASRALPSSGTTATTDTARDTNVVSPAATPSRTTVTRGVVTADAPAAVRDTHATNAATVSRATVSGPVPPTSTTATPSRGSAARSAATTTARDNLDTAVHTVGRNARVTAASLNSSAAVRRAGVSLRPSTAEVGGRATIGASGVQTGSNIGASVRSVQSRAATATTTVSQTLGTRETISEAKERLEQVADLNKSCQEQYNDCMDQFCAVIDANQKRCSCSANLSRYTRVESAVKEANTQLNEVAQRIRYVGLSADEIRAIMSATEAEDALTRTHDTTESRSMLDEIEALIVNPNSATSRSNAGFNNLSELLDMDLTFTGDGTDTFSLDFLNGNGSNNSMANLRGTELFNAAKKRCNSILTQCKNVGATSDQIMANYELAIDKDCIAYEQGLSKMNDSLKSNVRSANLMLQKARLAVQTNKNQYDAKGCIAALETCMTDDMVCGDDYTKCLDPTKKYIDENGEVVLGQNIGKIVDFTSTYDNSSINSDFVKSSINAPTDTKDGKGIVRYLMEKIGTGDKVTDGGLCRAVLDKCQRYTYDTNNTSKYNPYNDVVVNYIQRAMVNIRAAQSLIISDYASSCMTDIATCYNQQMSQVNSWSSSASVASIYRVMQGACYNVALTCAYAVFHDTQPCKTETDEKSCLLQNVSEMFYQNMLCPSNSVWTAIQGTAAARGAEGDYVNDHCKCATGYVIQNGGCYVKCEDGQHYATATATTCTEVKSEQSSGSN